MEILEFSASAFIALSNSLGRMDELLQVKTSDLHRLHNPSSFDILPDETLKAIKNTAVWSAIRDACNAIGLVMSVKSVDRLITISQSEKPTASQLQAAYAEMSERIIDELESKLFLHIPSSRVELY